MESAINGGPQKNLNGVGIFCFVFFVTKATLQPVDLIDFVESAPVVMAASLPRPESQHGFLWCGKFYTDMTDMTCQRKENVMKNLFSFPLTQGGAPLLACNLDESCLHLDCIAVVDEFGVALRASSEGRDFLAHYCGLQYTRGLQDHTGLQDL